CSRKIAGFSPGPSTYPAPREQLLGAIEGTRTPTPLRVHGPEPCASANSATSAFEMRRPVLRQRSDRDYFYILTGIAGLSNPTALYLRGAVAGMGAVIAETGAPALLSGIPTLS